MGIDNYFRALPLDDELVHLANEHKDIAEDALFPVLLSDVPNLHPSWPQSQLVRDLVKRYPELRNWHLDAGRWEPYEFAKLLHSRDVDAEHAKYGEPGFENSLALKFTQGDREFNEQFRSTTGFPIRVTSPEVVRRISEFSQSVEIGLLPEEYRELFLKLAAFYRLAASHGNLAVFFMRN